MNLYCPKCRGEYREGYSICGKCNLQLVKFENLFPYCPRCNKIYPSGTTICNDCETDLILNEVNGEILTQHTNPMGEIVTIYETSELTEVALIEAALQEANIKYNIRGEELSGIIAGGLLGGFNPVVGGIKIEVEKSNAEKGIEIIKSIIQ